jgi:hypothetical protein
MRRLQIGAESIFIGSDIASSSEIAVKILSATASSALSYIGTAFSAGQLLLSIKQHSDANGRVKSLKIANAYISINLPQKGSPEEIKQASYIRTHIKSLVTKAELKRDQQRYLILNKAVGLTINIVGILAGSVFSMGAAAPIMAIGLPAASLLLTTGVESGINRSFNKWYEANNISANATKAKNALVEIMNNAKGTISATLETQSYNPGQTINLDFNEKCILVFLNYIKCLNDAKLERPIAHVLEGPTTQELTAILSAIDKIGNEDFDAAFGPDLKKSPALEKKETMRLKVEVGSLSHSDSTKSLDSDLPSISIQKENSTT